MQALRGRASLGTFYASAGLFCAIQLLFQLMEAILVLTWPTIGTHHPLTAGPIGVALVALFVGALIRRLHDRNKSGWWLLVFFGPHVAMGTAVTQILRSQAQIPSAGIIAALVLVLPFTAWGFVEVFVLAGVRGPNRYGNDPLETTEIAG